MSGFDANRTYSVPAHGAPAATSPDLPSETEQLLYEFLQHFRIGEDFIYRWVPLIAH